MIQLHALNQAHAERTVADGGGWLFRAGEWDHPIDGIKKFPPASFVEACQPCETCGGSGVVDHPLVTGSSVWACCPDCHNGRRSCVLVVQGDPYLWTDYCSDLHTIKPCNRCVVMTKHEVRWVASVVAVGEPLRVEAVQRRVSGWWFATEKDWWQFTLPPDVDPASLVGQWALRIEVLP